MDIPSHKKIERSLSFLGRKRRLSAHNKTVDPNPASLYDQAVFKSVLL